MNGVEHPEFSDPLRICQGDSTGQKIVKKGIEIHGSFGPPIDPVEKFLGRCELALLPCAP